MKFREIFQDLCLEKGVTIKEVSKDTKIKLQKLYKLCENERYPTFKICILLCNYFNCSIDYFIGLSDSFEKKNIYDEKKFIINYKNLLKEHNLTHYTLSKKVGIDRNRIYDWENGKYPYIPTLITIAKYFNITLGELIG